MNHPIVASLGVLVTSLTVQGAEPATKPESPTAEKTKPAGQWRSKPPTDCPFKPSVSLIGIEFTGHHSDYRCGDTFYPSWASDGNLYSPWTDGKTDGVDCQPWKVPAHTGHAVMIGSDPLKLEIHNTSPPKEGPAAPDTGRYPAGSLMHNGIWYYGTYMKDFGSKDTSPISRASSSNQTGSRCGCVIPRISAAADTARYSTSIRRAGAMGWFARSQIAQADSHGTGWPLKYLPPVFRSGLGGRGTAKLHHLT